MRLIFAIIIIFTSCVSKKNVASNSYVIPSALYGKWQVIELNISPFEHFNACGKLDLGTIFRFTEERQFQVFDNEMNQICNYPQSFSVNGKELGVMLDDNGIRYTIENLNDEMLMLRTTRIPTFFPQKRKKYSEGFEKDSIGLRIETEGILIKLEKKRD